MRNLWVSSLVLTLLAASAVGQAPEIGTTEVIWANNLGSGTPILAATVHYPAIASATNAAVLPTNSGYPVVVFLHGWGRLGSEYYRLGQELAALGIVAVMMNTAQFSFIEMEADTHAMFGALRAANGEFGGFFQGTMDMSRVALLGHSMGGAVLALVLDESPNAPSNNPGYKCALGLAPVNPAIASPGIEVHVPVGLVSGQGDMLTPPATHAVPFYNALDPVAGLKFHYRLNTNCTHMNLVGLDQANLAIFERSMAIVKGFFGQFLSGSPLGLEGVLGVDAMSDPNLVGVDVETIVPQTWGADSLRVGATTRVSVAVEAGFAGLIVANSMAPPTPTFLGNLLLDPASAYMTGETFIATERLDILFTIPAEPELIGTTIAVQGVGPTVSSIFMLGSAQSLTIGS